MAPQAFIMTSVEVNSHQSYGGGPMWVWYRNSWRFCGHRLHPFLHERRIEKNSSPVLIFFGSLTI